MGLFYENNVLYEINIIFYDNWCLINDWIFSRILDWIGQVIFVALITMNEICIATFFNDLSKIANNWENFGKLTTIQFSISSVKIIVSLWCLFSIREYVMFNEKPSIIVTTFSLIKQ